MHHSPFPMMNEGIFSDRADTQMLISGIMLDLMQHLLAFQSDENTDQQYNSIFDKFEKLLKASSEPTANLKHDSIVN